MIIRYHDDAGHMAISDASGEYVFWQLTDRERNRIIRYKAKGWIGRAWQILRPKPFFKEEGEERCIIVPGAEKKQRARTARVA